MSQCFKCSEPISLLKDSIACLDCKNLFHPACTRIGSMDVFKKLKAAQKSTWKCDECKLESSSAVSTGSKNDPEQGDSKILDCLHAMRTDMNNQFMRVNDQFVKVNENVSDVKQQLAIVNTTIEGIKDTVGELTTTCDSLRDAQTKLVEENLAMKVEIVDLKSKIVDLEQYTRRNNLEIVGVPVTEGEDIYYLLESLAKYIRVPFRREDISVAHRLPTRRPSRGSHDRQQANIVVSFVSRTSKETWKAAVRGKDLRAAELHDSFPSTKFFINHHLTPHNKAILGRARRYVKEKKLAAAWSTDTKVLAKRTLTSRPHRLYTLEDVDKVIQQES